MRSEMSLTFIESVKQLIANPDSYVAHYLEFASTPWDQVRVYLKRTSYHLLLEVTCELKIRGALSALDSLYDMYREAAYLLDRGESLSYECIERILSVSLRKNVTEWTEDLAARFLDRVWESSLCLLTKDPDNGIIAFSSSFLQCYFAAWYIIERCETNDPAQFENYLLPALPLVHDSDMLQLCICSYLTRDNKLHILLRIADMMDQSVDSLGGYPSYKHGTALLNACILSGMLEILTRKERDIIYEAFNHQTVAPTDREPSFTLPTVIWEDRTEADVGTWLYDTRETIVSIFGHMPSDNGQKTYVGKMTCRENWTVEEFVSAFVEWSKTDYQDTVMNRTGRYITVTGISTYTDTLRSLIDRKTLTMFFFIDDDTTERYHDVYWEVVDSECGIVRGTK